MMKSMKVEVHDNIFLQIEVKDQNTLGTADLDTKRLAMTSKEQTKVRSLRLGKAEEKR